jgi:hypothetical protein
MPLHPELQTLAQPLQTGGVGRRCEISNEIFHASVHPAESTMVFLPMTLMYWKDVPRVRRA